MKEWLEQVRVFNVASFIDNSFEVQNHYQNEPKFEGVYLRNSSPKIKDGTHVINLDVHKTIGAHCMAMSMNGGNVTYFESFWVKYILKQMKKFIGNKNITTNIYKIQA